MTLNKVSRPVLSICIPTYNRSSYLRYCIESVDRAVGHYWDSIELIVSDNASTDDTELTVLELKKKFPIRYYKNAQNIGAERNVFACATHAEADYVWIFGDDDEFCADAVPEALAYISQGFDLIVCNFSIWSKDMSVMLNPGRLSHIKGEIFNDPNAVLSTFGIHLGFISSIILRKSILLSVPESEYQQFIQFGFPHPYSIYRGLLPHCRVAYDSKPLFKERSDNSPGFSGRGGLTRLVKVFLEGPALVYEALEESGYDHRAVLCAKDMIVSEYFRVGTIVREIETLDRAATLRMMYAHYRTTWRFWLEWLPVLLIPSFLVRIIHSTYRALRKSGKICL